MIRPYAQNPNFSTFVNQPVLNTGGAVLRMGTEVCITGNWFRIRMLLLNVRKCVRNHVVFLLKMV